MSDSPPERRCDRWFIWMPQCLLLCLAVGLTASSATAQLPELPEESPEESSPEQPQPEEPSPDAPEAEPESESESEPGEVESDPFSFQTIECPEDLETLTSLLLADIPTYANRILQQALGDVPEFAAGPPLAQYRPAYVVLAGQPEQTPLDIDSRVYTTSAAAGESLEQVFFTTLERTYEQTEVTELENYHWLFLAPSDDGWRLAFMFSAINSADDLRPILPPQESSSGSVGRGVQQWLRDCRAGALRD